MFGAISPSLFFLAGFALLGAITDLARGRIYNWLTVSMMVSGIAYCFQDAGWTGAGTALLGIGAGLALFGWMFALGVLGGGDVKFLMGFGAWGGASYALETALLAVLLGGALSLGVLIFTGRIWDFLRRMRHFMMTVLIQELEPELPRLDRKSTVPFGIPIATAAIWAAYSAPLQHWGNLLWR